MSMPLIIAVSTGIVTAGLVYYLWGVFENLAALSRKNAATPEESDTRAKRKPPAAS